MTSHAGSAGPRRRSLLFAAIGFTALFITPFALVQHFQMRWYAIHSYVASVCSAVEDYHKENGEFPKSLTQIDKTMLDYDCNIPLERLNYQVTDSVYLR